MKRRIFVCSISLACPSVKITKRPVNHIRGVGGGIGEGREEIERGSPVHHTRRVPPPFCFSISWCHGPFNGQANSEDRTSAAVGWEHSIKGPVRGRHPLDARVIASFMTVSLNPCAPRFLNRAHGPVLSTVFTQHDHRCVGPWRCQNGQQGRLARFEVNNG